MTPRQHATTLLVPALVLWGVEFVRLGRGMNGAQEFALWGFGSLAVACMWVVVASGAALARAAWRRDSAMPQLYPSSSVKELQAVCTAVAWFGIVAHASLLTWYFVRSGDYALGQYSYLQHVLSNPLVAIAYSVFLAALAHLLGQGLSTMQRALSAIRDPHVQRRADQACMALAIVVYCGSVNVISHYATGESIVDFWPSGGFGSSVSIPR